MRSALALSNTQGEQREEVGDRQYSRQKYHVLL
jgi:hypothetical protein